MTVSTVEGTVVERMDADAREVAVKAEVARVLALDPAERSAYVDAHSLTVESARDNDVVSDTDSIESSAAVRVRQIESDRYAQGTMFQAALAFWQAKRTAWHHGAYSGQGDYVKRGLGYTSPSYGTILNALSDAAVLVGIEDGTPEWKHLCQNSATRKDLVKVVESAKTKADGTVAKQTVARAAKVIESATASAPKRTSKRTPAPAAESKAITADEARANVDEALAKVRTNVPHLTREGRNSLAVALDALAKAVREGSELPTTSLKASSGGKSARTGK